jgi:thioredoxin 1
MVRPLPMVGPILDEIAKEYEGKLTVAKVNIDENPMTPTQFAVRGIPTMILFKDGKPVDTKVGRRPRSEMKAWVDRSLGA